MAGVRRSRGAAVALLATALAAVPALARADSTPTGIVAESKTGKIDLLYVGAPSAQVTFSEQVGGRLVPLRSGQAAANGMLPELDVTHWTCARARRAFVATSTAPDGTVATSTYSVQTPTCATRIDLRAPSHVERGGSATIRLVDRWRLGREPVEVCTSGAGLPHDCRKLTLRAGAAGVAEHLRVRRDGHVRVVAGLAGKRTTSTIAVGTAKAVKSVSTAPVLLATGDSTIQGIDATLTERLSSAARVRSDFHPGTGISSPDGPSWQTYTDRQVKKYHPDITVMSLGANEGFPMTTPAGVKVACCDAGWTAEYTRRLEKMMTTYVQHGRAHVLWLGLPVPAEADRQKVSAAVNAAAKTATAHVPGVKYLPLEDLISPGGAFAASITYHGKSVRVRESDGVHLTAAGTSIAGGDAIAAIRGTGWLPAS